jgi:hypothetical protein
MGSESASYDNRRAYRADTVGLLQMLLELSACALRQTISPMALRLCFIRDPSLEENIHELSYVERHKFTNSVLV